MSMFAFYQANERTPQQADGVSCARPEPVEGYERSNGSTLRQGSGQAASIQQIEGRLLPSKVEASP